MIFDSVYCWQAPPIELMRPDGPLVPGIRMHFSRSDFDPVERANWHFDRFEPWISKAGRWHLSDQLPRQNIDVLFGGPLLDLQYGWHTEAAERYRRWWMAFCVRLRDLGLQAPEFMPIDWEIGESVIDYAQPWDRVRRERLAVWTIRQSAIRRILVDTAIAVWGQPIAASNYNDAGWVGGLRDHNGWELPAISVSNIASPVWYTRHDRTWRIDGPKQSPLDVKQTSDVVTNFIESVQITGDCVPWLAADGYTGDKMPPEEGHGLKIIHAVRRKGIGRFILWTNNKTMSDETATHLYAGAFGGASK